MTKIETLFKKLFVVGKVYEDTSLIPLQTKSIDFYKMIISGDATVKSFKSYTYKKEYDLMDIKTWTGNDFFKIQYKIFNNELVANIIRYFPDNRRGDDIHFEANISIPENYIFKCEQTIERQFLLSVNKMYDDYLNNERKEWIKNKIESLLEQ